MFEENEIERPQDLVIKSSKQKQLKVTLFKASTVESP
jgi:hypothetical protein